MGLNYRINCYTCHKATDWVEFSITDHYELKHPDEDTETILSNWIPFLFKHNEHRLDLIDSKGNSTDPTKITGMYVLGLEERPSP